MSEYDHTQKAPLYLILILAGGSMLAAALWAVADEPPWVRRILAGMGIFLLLISLCCRSLTVRDEDGRWLAIRYGPLPLLQKRIPYDRIERVEPTRSSLIDGFGIHYRPGKGWIYNLWGLDCVELTLGNRKLRIGTDDREGLAAFLRGRIGRARRGPGE